MLAKRIIPCLDVRDGMVVKGKNFTGIREVESPVALAQRYNLSGADELVFYDITASAEGRALFADTLKEVASCIFIPLTVGGGINTLDDFDMVLKCGADKVSVNTGAIRDPSLVGRAAKRYGDQCVVLSNGGRIDTGICAEEWAYRGQEEGAGELVLNSIDTDGVKGGFDCEMLQKVCARLTIPVIASGGAGRKEDFLTLFNEVPQADAGLAASIFHFGEVDIGGLKEYLLSNGVHVRR